MNATISSKTENDYLLIEASGRIDSLEEYKLLLRRYCDEIQKSGITKIIIVELNVQYSQSLKLQSDIVDSYEELPHEMRYWKVACVVHSDLIETGKFWEFRSRQGGYNYKAFSSLEEANKFMSD
jgi:hypothetical protein